VADYGFGGSGRGFLSIGPQKVYVNLYLMSGVDLFDPARLLEGKGKKLRHVQIRRVEGLENQDLHALIEAAAQMSQE
jgi:hypothetical protein